MLSVLLALVGLLTSSHCRAQAPANPHAEFDKDLFGAFHKACVDFAADRELDPEGAVKDLQDRQNARAGGKKPEEKPSEGKPKGDAYVEVQLRLFGDALRNGLAVQNDPIRKTGPQAEGDAAAYSGRVLAFCDRLACPADLKNSALNVYVNTLPKTKFSRGGDYKTKPEQTDAEKKEAQAQKEKYGANSKKTVAHGNDIAKYFQPGQITEMAIFPGAAETPAAELPNFSRAGGAGNPPQYQKSNVDYGRTVREGSVPTMPADGSKPQPKPAESKGLWARISDGAKDIQQTAVDYWSAGGRESLKNSEKMGENGLDGAKKFGTELWGKTQLVMSYAIDKAPGAAVDAGKFVARLQNPLDMEAKKELVVGTGHFVKEMAVGIKDSVVDAYHETKAIGDRPTTYQTLKATLAVGNAALQVVPATELAGAGVTAARVGLKSVITAAGREATEQAVATASREGVHEAVAAGGKAALENAGKESVAELSHTPGAYLAKAAPEQVTPGVKTVQGYLADGRPYTAHYDNYGRLVATPETAAAPVHAAPSLAKETGKDVGEVAAAQGVASVVKAEVKAAGAKSVATALASDAANAGGSEAAGVALKHGEESLIKKVVHHVGEDGVKDVIKKGAAGGAEGGGSSDDESDHR